MLPIRNSYYPNNDALTNQEMEAVIEHPNNRRYILDFEQHSRCHHVRDKILLINKIILVYLFSTFISTDWKQLTPADIDNIEISISANPNYPEPHKPDYIQLLREFQRFMDTEE